MNWPNALSILRIAFLPMFGFLYYNAKNPLWYLLAALVLLLSGITDLLDGFLARKLGQVTQLGKLLDPLADKLTQATVCILLGIRMPEFRVLLALFILKEALMLAAGFKLYRKNKSLDGSRWFGKLYTVVFYVIMLLVVAFPGLKSALVFGLLIVMAAFMLFAFVMYLPVFFSLWRGEDAGEG